MNMKILKIFTINKKITIIFEYIYQIFYQKNILKILHRNPNGKRSKQTISMQHNQFHSLIGVK